MKENLFTAARRLVRNVNVDSQGGGLLSLETEKASALLQIQIDVEDKRRKHEDALFDLFTSFFVSDVSQENIP